MKITTIVPAAALALALASLGSMVQAQSADDLLNPAAYAQLAAAAGLTPDEAAGLSISELNALKYTRGGRRNN